MLMDEWHLESFKLLRVLEKAIENSLSRLNDNNNESIEDSMSSKFSRQKLKNIFLELKQTQLEREVLKALGKFKCLKYLIQNKYNLLIRFL